MFKYGILPIIFLIFLIMKLAEIGTVATWSWWLVFSPLIIQVGIVFFVWFIVGFIVYHVSK